MELWKASLCGCMDDCTSCCLTFWCPCFQYGFNKQATTGEGCCVPCCVYFLVVSLAWPVMPCIAASNRTTIRQVYNLPAQVRKGSQINRFFFAAMCPSLSLSLPFGYSRTLSILTQCVLLFFPSSFSLAMTAASTASASLALCARRLVSFSLETLTPLTLPSTSSEEDSSSRWLSLPRPHRSLLLLPLLPQPLVSQPLSSRSKAFAPPSMCEVAVCTHNKLMIK